MKKLLLLLPAVLILSGCQKSIEVRDRGFIQSVGVDNNDTCSIAVNLLGDSELCLKGEGPTIFSALDNTEIKQSKSLFTGHMELLVLSKGRFKSQLELMLSNNRISPSCSVIFTNESAAAAIEEYGGEKMLELLDSHQRKGIIIKKNLNSVLEDMLGSDGKAAVPVIAEGDLTMGIADADSIVTVLSQEESMGLCWLEGGISEFFLPVVIGDNTCNFYIRKSDTKTTAEINERGGVEITFEIKINGELTEEGYSWEDVKSAVASKITVLCRKTIAKTVIAYDSDVLGIEKSIINKSPEAASLSWDEMSKNISFYYNVRIAR